MKNPLHIFTFLLALPWAAQAQVNSGSNGSDGAFNPTTNTVINMADHTNGIYQYTSVNIPTNITVTFIPNANNSPVIWLVQSNVIIGGIVDVSGKSYLGQGRQGLDGGPGGYRGGNGGVGASVGQGLGGGMPGQVSGGAASYATLGTTANGYGEPGTVYGNSFIIPLLGGSGGGGSVFNVYGGGGGGGGAVLIAASGMMQLNGSIQASGGDGQYGGGGSGGAVRLITPIIVGGGSINTSGGSVAGKGRVRFDTLENNFGGTIFGVFSQGFQPIIIPVAGQGVQLSIASVAGASVSATPSGQLVSPDSIIPGQQANPVPIVVHCSNLPLNTPVTVTVKPANGAAISAVGLNNSGTLASSTATVSLVMPRGGGLIYATANNQ